MRHTFFIVSFLVSWAFTYAQKDIAGKILEYYGKVPQEKLYIHTDKSFYVAGDTIWMRIHMIDAATNKPVCRSKFVYVELLNNHDNSVSRRVMIKADKDSVFANMIALPPDMAAGQYTLTAYTQWMRNFGHENFFYKQLVVVGDDSPDVGPPVSDSIKAISLALLPEGGHLIAGKQQKLAYKAIGDNGKGVDVNIQLVDEAGNVLKSTHSEHLGMGYLHVCVEEGENLFVIATTESGITCKTALPKALKSGAVLKVEQRKSQLFLQPIFTEDIDVKQFSVVLYGSGNLLVIALDDYTEDSTIRISTNKLREGVVNIALVDQNRIWSERMVFISQSCDRFY